MPELLLEVGCEELPATFVHKAFTDLHDFVLAALREADLLEANHTSQTMGTPRRLIVSVGGLKARQEDQSKELKGPSLKAAFDDQGNPTPAMLGFCRNAGVDPANHWKDEQYVWVTKLIAGRPTNEILQEVLPKAIRSLSFDKSMRWGASRMRFARPIRWILASLDGGVVDFDIEGVRAGLRSRGHRFYAPEEFEAKSYKGLLEGLRARKVEPDPDLRRPAIVDQTKKVAGGEPTRPEARVEENVYLTEWPTAIQGNFRNDFLSLPVPVLTTAMAKHEKMFPVRDAENKLTTHFVFIRNSGEEATVRAGNEWVLNARFNDAKFFFDEDTKYDLAHFLEKTSGIVFHKDLGSVRQRAERLHTLSSEVAKATGAGNDEVAFAAEAGRFAKADLSTGLVSELPSLQGIIGEQYARREGWNDAVCHAIGTHYDGSKNDAPDSPGARTAVRVLIADQLDKLAGYLGVGLEPSGSSDPFALRRAATMLIEAAWGWPTRIPAFDPLFAEATKSYVAQGFAVDGAKALKSASGLFASRYTALLPQVRHDILDAALAGDTLAPREVRLRIECLEILATDQAFIHASTRPLNIVAAAHKKRIVFGTDLSSLDSAEGEALLKVAKGINAELEAAEEREDAAGIAALLKALVTPINLFFDETMVMVDDAKVRDSRLALLNLVSQQLLLAGDFSKLVIEG